MKLKKINLLVLTSLLLSMMFVSCSDDDDPTIDPVEVSVGAYILNNGNWGGNDANIVYYDFAKNQTSGDIYRSQNGQLLGDLGQDILVHGSKIYVTVYGSNAINVLDLDCKLIKTIQSDEFPTGLQGPRCLTAYQKYVFLTFYDSGHLAVLDTTTLNIRNQVKVGHNPEGVVVANGKAYVANSGGNNYPDYDNTISVVDFNTFTVTNTLEVPINPTTMVKDNQEDVYLVSMGDYGDVPNTVSRIATKVDVVTKVRNGTMIASAGDKLYIIYAQYGMSAGEVQYIEYDAINENVTKTNFITDGTIPQNPYSISCDKSTGNIYIGESDYVTNGTMNIYSSDGKKQTSFDTGGLNPVKAVFVAK